jgi:hypothetical protein
MAFIGALMPYLAAASTAGAVYGEAQKSIASNYNAKVDANTHDTAINQSAAQEGMVRRMGRETLGRQTAAFGAAGVGYGGSSEGALDQSAINQEYDALNTRYKGSTTAYGYGVNAGLQQDQAKGYGLMAGAALLKGVGSNIDYTRLFTSSPGTPGAGT